MIAAYLSTLGLLFLALHVTTMAEEGRISARKVGGIRFLKIGRFGASFYVSRN